MLYRNKKENDINEGKWIGLGGKLIPGESPEECLVREVREEVGVTLTRYTLRGLITFELINHEPIYIFVYDGFEYEGEVQKTCDEGELKWIEDAEITSHPIWEGDVLLHEWLAHGLGKPFSAKFVYDGDILINKMVIFH